MKANFMDKCGKWCDEKDEVPEEVTLTENFTLMELAQRYFLTLKVQVLSSSLERSMTIPEDI